MCPWEVNLALRSKYQWKVVDSRGDRTKNPSAVASEESAVYPPPTSLRNEPGRRQPFRNQRRTKLANASCGDFLSDVSLRLIQREFELVLGHIALMGEPCHARRETNRAVIR